MIYKNVIKGIRTLSILICLIASAAAISVAGQTPSRPMDLTLPVPAATPPFSAPTSVPEVLKDPVLLAQILAKLQAETLRADSKSAEVEDLKKNRDEYKKTADLERARGDELAKAERARSEEAASLRMAETFLRQSVDEYKTETADLRREVDRLRGSRKWYALGGAALGAGVCAGIYGK